MFSLISAQIFTAVKNAISHLKGYKMCFREKIIVILKAETVFPKNRKSKECGQKNHKILENQKML